MAPEISTKKWQVSDKNRQRVIEIRKEIENDRKEFEKSTPPCPIDRLPGKFVKYDGAYTRGFAIFKCPKGHEFKVG